MVDLSKYGLMVTDGDKAQAAYKGLMNFGAQLMAASAPSTQPGGFARGFGKGAQAFSSTYDNAMNAARQRQLQGYQIDRQMTADDRAKTTFDQSQTDRTTALAAAGVNKGRYAKWRELNPAMGHFTDSQIDGYVKAENTAKFREQKAPVTVFSPTTGKNELVSPNTLNNAPPGTYRPERKPPASGMVPDGKGGWKMDPGYRQFGIDKASAGKMELHTGKKMGEVMIDRLDEGFNKARLAVEDVNRLNSMAVALKNSNVGFGAQIGQGWDQVATMMGVGGKDSRERLENTRTLMQGLAEMTLSARGSMRGQGTITDGETVLLERARSGDISLMTRDELAVIMGVAARAAQVTHSQYADTLKRAGGVPEIAPYLPMFGVSDLPQYTPPVFAQPGENPSGVEIEPEVEDLIEKYRTK